MSSLVTSSTIPSGVQEFYDRQLLKRALPLLVYNKFGQERALKQGTGKTIRFRRYAAFAAATTPLTEGVTPAGRSMSASDVTATVLQYGDWTSVTDVVTLTHTDQVIAEAVKLFGEQTALTLDTVLRDVLMTGTNIQYANSVASQDLIAAKLADTDFQKIVQTLRRSNVPPITSMITASTGVGTTPVQPCYVAVCHVDCERDLRALKSSGFVPVEDYPAQRGVMEGEFGAGWGIRFVGTSNAPVLEGVGTTPATGVKGTGGKTDVYQMLIFGEDAFGRVPLTGSNSGVIVKAASKSDTNTSDPLNQRSSVGWKTMYTGAILDDTRAVRYEHGVSA